MRKILAIDGRDVENLLIDILDAKSEQKRRVEVPKIKKELLLSKIEMKPTSSLGLSKWQRKKFQNLSAEKLKRKELGVSF